MSEKLIYVKKYLCLVKVFIIEIKEPINFSFVSCKFCSWKFLELVFAFDNTVFVIIPLKKKIYIYIYISRKLCTSVALRKKTPPLK